MGSAQTHFTSSCLSCVSVVAPGKALRQDSSRAMLPAPLPYRGWGRVALGMPGVFGRLVRKERSVSREACTQRGTHLYMCAALCFLRGCV